MISPHFLQCMLSIPSYSINELLQRGQIIPLIVLKILSLGSVHSFFPNIFLNNFQIFIALNQRPIWKNIDIECVTLTADVAKISSGGDHCGVISAVFEQWDMYLEAGLGSESISQ